MTLLRTLSLALAMLIAGVAYATASDLRSVAGMQFHYNVLIAFTPSFKDARLTTQRAILARLALEASKRDLLFIQVAPRMVIGANDKPDGLRRRFNVPVSTYRTVLIGKSGRPLGFAPGPIAGAAIIRAIDKR